MHRDLLLYISFKKPFKSAPLMCMQRQNGFCGFISPNICRTTEILSQKYKLTCVGIFTRRLCVQHVGVAELKNQQCAESGICINLLLALNKKNPVQLILSVPFIPVT